MNKIIIAILTFLLWIMPWFTPLHAELTRRTFDGPATWSAIAQCVEDGDAETLAGMMRPWFEKNISDLSGRIERLLGNIRGDITGITIDPKDLTDYNNGIYSIGKVIVVNTADHMYHVRVVYEVTNVQRREEVGIARLQLTRRNATDTGYYILDDIKAPGYK